MINEAAGSQNSTDSEARTDSYPSTISTLLDSQGSDSSTEQAPLLRTYAFHPSYQPPAPELSRLLRILGIMSNSRSRTATEKNQIQRRHTI